MTMTYDKDGEHRFPPADTETRTSAFIGEYGLTECGCGVAYVESMQAIDYCPLHQAAPALLTALEGLMREFPDRRLDVRKDYHKMVAIEYARTILRAAKGDANA